jgi:hypothetical protein
LYTLSFAPQDPYILSLFLSEQELAKFLDFF